jgi:hypothetical protein
VRILLSVSLSTILIGHFLPVSPITGIVVVAGATVVVVEVTAGVAADVVDAPDVGVDGVASVVDAIVVTPTVVAREAGVKQASTNNEDKVTSVFGAAGVRVITIVSAETGVEKELMTVADVSDVVGCCGFCGSPLLPTVK